MNQSHSHLTPKITGAFVIAAVLVIAIYTLVLNNKQSTTADSVATTTSSTVATDTTTPTTATTTPAASTNTSTTPTATTPAVTTPSTPTYKDGTYKSTVSYRVPHGTNTLNATITLKDGVVTAVATTSSYSDGESAAYISSFENSVTKAVVGKKITSSFSYRIGGASLTGGAFISAVNSVISKSQA